MERKFVGGNVVQVKQEDRNGVPVGIVEGYIATWDIDRGDYFGTKDQFIRGAFLDSILDHKRRNRPIRLKDHHGRTIGGFPADSIEEDNRGLFGRGEINLDVQQGREAFALAKQGVLSDFSIGFSIDENGSLIDETTGIRKINKATIWEGSIVDEPMNPEANILAVKALTKFQDLPIAAKETEWDKSSALENVWMLETDAQEKAFIGVGEGVIPLLIADTIEGELTVIPKAIEAAALRLKEEQFEETDLKSAIKHLEKYYAKMNVPSPFAEEEKQFFSADDVKDFTIRQFEKALIKSGCFSKEAAKFLGSKTELKATPTEEPEEVIEMDEEVTKGILSELNSIKSMINKK